MLTLHVGYTKMDDHIYYNFAVRIPSEKGKIITKTKGESSYVIIHYVLNEYKLPKLLEK